MRALVLVLLAAGATAALAARNVDTGRSLLQAVTCTEPHGCQACPDGCDTSQPDSCVGSTRKLFKCVWCREITQEDLGGASFTEKWANRVPQADGSCGCQPGYSMERQNNQDICVICPVGSYCPGGSQAFQATSAAKVACGTGPVPGLTTRNKGAATAALCVNAPGYRFVPPADGTSDAPSAAECTGNTYSVGFRGQISCTACPGGMRLANGLEDNVTLWAGSASPIPAVDPAYKTVFVSDGVPATKAASASKCLVPPGSFAVGRSKVIRCPKGEYRTGYVSQGTETSKCVPCPRGTTTFGSGSPTVEHCDQLVPGFYWLSGTTRSAGGSDTNPVTSICDQKFYCPGGYATGPTEDSPTGKFACPSGMWTKATRSTAHTDCMIPPGHFMDKTDPIKPIVKACNAGDYSPDWRPDSTLSSVETCQKCGTNIRSDPVELLPTFNVTNSFNSVQYTTRVARTSASCYIEAGEGMVFSSGSYRKINCSSSNYGVPARQWQLRLTPCRECPQGTVTAGGIGNLCTTHADNYKGTSGGFTNPAACCTPPGWGFDGIRATLCPRGTYNDGKLDPADKCKQCPAGRTTAAAADAAYRNELSDCDQTLPGWGWQGPGSFNSSTNASLTLCPLGTYSVGDAVAGSTDPPNCATCGLQRTTLGQGSVSQDDCDVCPAGQGASSSTSHCTICSEGTYGDANRPRGSLACAECPNTPSTFTFPYGDEQIPINVLATTEEGASSVQQCVAKFAPVVDDINWYMPSSSPGNPFLGIPMNPAAACMDLCAQMSDCLFFTYDYTPTATSPCGLQLRNFGSSAGVKTALKTIAASNPAGDEASSRRRGTLTANSTARSGKPAAMGAGVWSWWSDEPLYGDTSSINARLTQGRTVEECLYACNDDEVCAGVVVRYSSSSNMFESCSYLQGRVTTTPGDPSTALRSMIKYRTAGTDKPDGL